MSIPAILNRTTVLIPLHGAHPYIERINQTLLRLPKSSKVILSDQSQLDDSLQTLRVQHQQDPRLFFRSAHGPFGWRNHVNSVLADLQTEFFCVIAQDDTIKPGYIEHLEAALDANPTAGVAFGKLEAIGLGTKSQRQWLDGPRIPLGVESPWIEALELFRHWNLGIPYRGLIRTELLQPISATPNDYFADQVWIFSLALVSHLIEVPEAIYVKYYHQNNTHNHWQSLSDWERKIALAREIQTRLGPKHEALLKLGLRLRRLGLYKLAYRIHLQLSRMGVKVL